MRRYPNLYVILMIVLALGSTGCSPQAAPAAEPVESASSLKVAAVFPGVITDADYNTLAYVGLTEARSALGFETAYSEGVGAPDVDRVVREYIDAGYNVIWTHGGQYVTQTTDLATRYPEVAFIAEGDAVLENSPENLWFIDRNFHTGFYAIGVTAALASRTGKIGYIGGQALPFSYAEVHAIQQALADQGLEAELKMVWTGDFNDPSLARQTADELLAEGVDVLIGSLNLGMFGVFEAVKASPTPVLVTAKYSDKTAYAPDNYITTLLYDFGGPLKDILTRIQNGERGGYYPLSFDTGVSIQMPLKNVDPDVQAQVEEVIKKIQEGTITVKKDVTAVQ